MTPERVVRPVFLPLGGAPINLSQLTAIASIKHQGTDNRDQVVGKDKGQMIRRITGKLHSALVLVIALSLVLPYVAFADTVYVDGDTLETFDGTSDTTTVDYGDVCKGGAISIAKGIKLAIRRNGGDNVTFVAGSSLNPTVSVDSTYSKGSTLTAGDPAYGTYQDIDLPSDWKTEPTNTLTTDVGVSPEGEDPGYLSSSFGLTTGNTTGTASATITYTISGTAVNGSSLQRTATVTVAWNVTSTACDSTAPVVSADPAGGLYNSDKSVMLSANETAGIYYTTDGATPTKSSTKYASAISITSTTTLKFFGVDAAGNASSVSTETYTIDKTAPETSIMAGPGRLTNDNTPSFSWSGSDNLTAAADLVFSYGLNSGSTEGAWSAYSSDTNVTLGGTSGLADGSYSFEVRAKDAAGNVDGSPATSSFTVDATAPDAPVITSPANNSYNNTGSFSVSGKAEAGSTIELFESTTSKGTTTTDASGNWTKPLSDVADGSHTYTAKTTDAAGNTSLVSSGRTVIVDTIAPEKPNTPDLAAGSDVGASDADNITNDSTPSLSGTAEAGSTIELFDGTTSLGTTNADASGNWSKTLTSELSDGTHSFTVKATDAAGNTSDASDALSVKVDTVAPTVVYTSASGTAGDNGWYKSAVTVKFTADDGTGSGFIVNGEASATKTSTTTTNGDGSAVAADSPAFTDLAGNTAAAGTVSRTYKVDTTAPVIERNTSADGCSAPGNSGWCRGEQIAGFTASDATSGLASAAQASFTKSSTTNGSTVDIASGSVTDLAGNTNNGINAGPFKIDSMAPSIADAGFVSGTAGDNGWYKSAVTNGFTASDATSGLADTARESFSKSSGTAEGAVVKISSGSVSDVAGNTNTGIDSTAYKIDLSKPYNIQFVDGPADGGSYDYGDTPAAPTCTASDDVSGLKSCVATGHSTAVGTHTMTATATDNAGHTETATRFYTVKGWTLKGFYSPVNMGVDPATGKQWVNTVKNGSTVPLKFEAFKGTTELTDTAIVTMSVRQITSIAGTEDAIETTTTGSTSLRYDTTSGQFVYNWKTPTSAGSSYSVTATFADGSTITAYFKLK